MNERDAQVGTKRSEFCHRSYGIYDDTCMKNRHHEGECGPVSSDRGGGLSQRWRAERAHTYASENADHYRGFDAGRLRSAKELDAAKLRIEEAVKALPAYLHRDDKDAGPLSVSSRTAVLKIIREIL